MNKKYAMSDGAAVGIFAAGLYAGNSMRKLLKAIFESCAKEVSVNPGSRLGRELFYGCIGLSATYVATDIMCKTYNLYKAVQERGEARRKAQQNTDTVEFN